MKHELDLQDHRRTGMTSILPCLIPRSGAHVPVDTKCATSWWRGFFLPNALCHGAEHAGHCGQMPGQRPCSATHCSPTPGPQVFQGVLAGLMDALAPCMDGLQASSARISCAKACSVVHTCTWQVNYLRVSGRKAF